MQPGGGHCATSRQEGANFQPQYGTLHRSHFRLRTILIRSADQLAAATGSKMDSARFARDHEWKTRVMNDDATTKGDVWAELSPRWQRAFRWVEEEVGGTLLSARRQARWRPAWFLELERDGGRLPLYYRGERGEVANGFEALEFEAGILRKLEAEGIPVPHVYGVHEDPGGIVMDCSPGRANLATASDDVERVAVLNDYVDILARMHALDPAGFADLGLRVCDDDEALGLGDFDSWESGFRGGKARPEPEIEFLIAWIHRNIPRGRTRRSFVCADAGQFLFDGPRVTALIDFELAYVGDPAADLGALRCRDLSEPLGNLAPAIERYEEKVGEEIERSVIDYHTVRFATCTPLAVAPMVARALPGLDFVQYLSWYIVYARTPLEVIADGIGLELPDLPEPDSTPTRHSPGHQSLLGMLEASAENADEFVAYERDRQIRLATYLSRAELMGPEIEARNLDDLESLLSCRPASAAEGDAALEAFVLEAAPEAEAELIPILHRRLQRQQWLIEPVIRELRTGRMQRL